MNLSPFVLLFILSILSLSAGAPSKHYFSSVSSNYSSDEETREDKDPHNYNTDHTPKQIDEIWKGEYHPDLSPENRKLLEEKDWEKTFCQHAKVVRGAFIHLSSQVRRGIITPPLDKALEQGILVAHGATSKLYSAVGWRGKWRSHFHMGYSAYQTLTEINDLNKEEKDKEIKHLNNASKDLNRQMKRSCWNHNYIPNHVLS
ncbi:hypothetical protein BJ684DRAFT_15022 [Piptocephalis cylindrospora]|uniref:Uncharacterized protein n=1 Tax=Piptocephalis cylindrospora TaxID=1907219 RepID=A0A4P9Y768_9FUNG|nr:hypothetical protein BJ684DRAFT_15022 [Piptocephalis cylindrospora]|eukprot:RKP14662.1 hypothetical protein BJ684DRAFT_15022 [Piptocephalis cylindrospora]